MYLIGLGNPGTKYEKTRHNIGRLVVSRLHDTLHGNPWRNDKHANAFCAEGQLAGHALSFVLPETFMNRSGETARFLVSKRGASLDELVVLYDDVDLAFGTVRIGVGRGDGGHNGIKSIASSLGSKDFIRIRIGIAPTSFWTGKMKRPAGGGALERFVLGRLSRAEERALSDLVPLVTDIVATIATDGVERAMNRYNERT